MGDVQKQNIIDTNNMIYKLGNKEIEIVRKVVEKMINAKLLILAPDAIIENINKSTDDKQKPAIKFFSKYPENIGHNDINMNNDNKKSEIYKKWINNEKLKSMRIQLGKSQSTGLFPKIKIS